jgi:potassium channel
MVIWYISFFLTFQKIVKFLDQQGLNINQVDKFGNTPLREALKNDKMDVAEYLWKHGAKLKLPTSKCAQLLCTLANRGKLEQLKAYIEFGGIDPCVADYDQRTALHLACSEGNLEIAKYLLSKGAKIEQKDRFGNNAMDCAIMSKNEELIEYFRSLLIK